MGIFNFCLSYLPNPVFKVIMKIPQYHKQREAILIYAGLANKPEIIKAFQTELM